MQDKSFAGPVEAVEVNGPDIKAENDFGKTTVKPESKQAKGEGKKLRYRFPAHSYTMLKVKLA
jgi:alpha-N-arabinofuranosidase